MNPQPDFRPAQRSASARTAALGLAVVIGIAVAGMLIYYGFVRPAPPSERLGGEIPPIQVEDLLKQQDESGRGMTIQIMDKQDPTRLAAEVLAERYDPDGPSHRLVEKPSAWLFAKDGSAWHIESKSGRFYIPEGEQSPREGFLKGDVRARRFDPTPGRRPDLAVDRPTIVATTDQPLHFNLDLLQFETEGRLDLKGDDIEFAGRGVFVVLNEQRESINWLRVDQGERLVYIPKADPDAGPMAPLTSAPRRGTRRAGPPASAARGGEIVLASFQPAVDTLDAAGPKVDLYRTTFRDNIKATQGPREIRSDSLTVWTRLVDNEVPEKQSPATAAAPVPSLLASLVVSAPLPFPNAVAGEPAPPDAGIAETPSAPVPVVLTWDGPMEVAPLADIPAELGIGDDIALRFEVAEGHVEFADHDAEAHGRAMTVAYFAGRERVELTGSAGSVELVSPANGRISGANTLYIELAAGVVTVPTAGELTGRDHADEPGNARPQRITWRSGASFAFAVENGRMTDRIERASFSGEARGVNQDATLDGERIDAIFDAGQGEQPRLVQLNVERAIGADGRGGSVAGDLLEVHFARGTGGEELDPTRVVISGSAIARRENAESIAGRLIDARLARDEAGDVIVTEAEADGQVVFSDGKGVTGEGEHLWTDALAEKAVVSGAGARVTRLGTTIGGDRIDLDGPGRVVRVEGPGDFEHRETGDAPRVLTASWATRMHFDDRLGTLECEGEARADSRSQDGNLDTVEAHRIEMQLDPFVDGEDTQGEQRLRTARAIGTAARGAAVESRRVGAEAAADRVDEIYRLEGREIRLLAKENRLSVPGSGRLFVLDRRAEAEDRPGEGSATGGGSRGTSLFTWEGSLSFDRGKGDAIFSDTVRVAHKPLGQQALTEVTSDRLVARFSTSPDSGEGDLLWAEALGNAVLRIEQRREIAASRLLYYAERGLVEAVSAENGRVEVQDLIRGTTSTSRAMRWNLTTDLIEIINPGSVVTPE
jgi:lipopolysaccharide export system protein LptA